MPENNRPWPTPFALSSGTDNDFDRPSGTGASLYRYPGTSCLATISLSLRDKSHSPIEAPRIELALVGFTLGYAFMGLPGRRTGAKHVQPGRLTY
jgi:hypothetical protein